MLIKDFFSLIDSDDQINHNFSEKENDQIDNIKLFTKKDRGVILKYAGDQKLNLGILSIIALRNDRDRKIFLESINEIFSNKFPFDVMRDLIINNKEKDPLSSMSKEYWKSVSDYLFIELKIDTGAMKNGKKMIRTVGVRGYDNLTENQRNYVRDLVKHTEFFDNSYLMSKGFQNECEIIRSL